jgi:hypothetical protein
VDQTASSPQTVLWRVGEQRKNANLDSDERVRLDSNHEKTTGLETKSIHNFTDFKPYAFRQNAHFMPVCGRPNGK